ncbi:hypothetical protein ACIQGZ_11320 [Streptomyces sp. NPDC092296]|uniref:hypothetical protein n=1 Tax=Streptomyces sp. NPDC092296 TaxID=3366012 RepID=UPI0037FBE7A5
MQESDNAGGAADLPDDAQGGDAAASDRTAPEGTPERRPPAGSQAEQDAIFKELVASFNAPVDLRTWPESEDLNDVGGRPGAPGDPGDVNRLADFAPQPRPRPRPNPGPSDPRSWQAADDPDDDHFIPPEPPPLPTGDTTAKFAWLAVLGGPALLLFSALAWRDISGWPAVLGVTAFIGGFVTLVARMKDRDEDDDDPTGGAVV